MIEFNYKIFIETKEEAGIKKHTWPPFEFFINTFLCTLKMTETKQSG